MEDLTPIPTNEPTPTTVVPTPIAAVELHMSDVISTTQYIGMQQSAAWSPSSDLSSLLLVLLLWVLLMWLPVFYRWGLLSWFRR